MEAIRSQLKPSNLFMTNYVGGHLDCHDSILYAVTKRTTNRDNKQKINKKLREKASEYVNPYFSPQNMFNLAFLEPQ